MLAEFTAFGGPGCVNTPLPAASAAVERRKRIGFPSGSLAVTWNWQRPFCGQVTIGGNALTGELFAGLVNCTLVCTLLSRSGLLMWAFGATFAEMRQQLSMRAVQGPALAYWCVIVVSTAGRLAGSSARPKNQLFVGSIEVTLK